MLLIKIRSLGNVQAKIFCATCDKEVQVVIVPFGTGYVAACPECGGVAYSEQDLPE